MSARLLPFPLFTAISEQVYLRNTDAQEAVENQPAANAPTTILIYGWGDGLPKHVSKYTDGYHKLYPSAQMLVVISPTLTVASTTMEQKSRLMMGVVDTVFPTTDDSKRILVHVMSNTGGIYFAATLNAYAQRHGAEHQLPHMLLVSDSTPGGLVFREQVGRWSRAMALGTADRFPWPFFCTHALWYVFLYVNAMVEWVQGRDAPGVHATKIINDPELATQKALRLFMYSKEDDLIHWEDLEKAAALQKSLGWQVELEMFEGSPHVGHMRLHPGQYWAAIDRAWQEAVKAQ